MRKFLGVAILALASVVAVGVLVDADGPPPWAYGFATPVPPDFKPAPPPAAPPPAAAPDPTPRHLPGNTLSFTLAQIRDMFGPADWYPGDHPTMPDIVAHGKRPNVRACGLCHYPNGKGRPENSGVSGLPVAYFIQTMNDFKNDNRKSSDPRKPNTRLMTDFAKNMTDDEVKATAEYFAQIKWTTPWIRVVETNMVPKTRIAGGLFLAEEGNEKEPIAGRIIEVPENTEGSELLRDPRSGFIAYAPVGSLKKGEELVNKGGGKTTQCAVCHGADLKGLGPVPPIAGRSPSYTVRQLYDMQQGARKGIWTDLMKPVVANLSEEDMLAIAAYTASRMP